MCTHETVPLAPPYGCGRCSWSRRTANKCHLLHLPIVGTAGVLIKRQTVPSAPPHGYGHCEYSRQTSNIKQCHLHWLTAVGTAGVLLKQLSVSPAPPHGCGSCRCFHQTINSATSTTPRLWALKVCSSNSKQCHLHRTAVVGAAGVITKQQPVLLAPHHGCGHCRCSYKTANSIPYTAQRFWALQVFTSNSKPCHLHRPTVVFLAGVPIKQ